MVRNTVPEAMRQSQHRSAPQALLNYNDAEARLGVAARLLGLKSFLGHCGPMPI